MSEYTSTELQLLSMAENSTRQKIVDKHAVIMNLFQTLLQQNSLDHETVLLCTEGGLILHFSAQHSVTDLSGRTLSTNKLFHTCKNLNYYTDISGYIFAVSAEPTLIEQANAFASKLKQFVSVFDSASDENKRLLGCLNAVKTPISIYDKQANLLFGNTYFANYLHIEDLDAVLGMNIDEIIKNSGVKVYSMESNSNHLKMYDVLHDGEDAIDWEVRIETSENDAQLVGNDMFPVLNSAGKVDGMVEVMHSRQQSLNQTKKLAGLRAEYNFENIIGASPAIRQTIRDAKDYANSPFSLLIYGESGVGKELFAQSVHNYSQRGKGPFVAVNCASFPENLIESELFGYVGGAFTGASKNGQIGKFELADRGTLFLDEIGELPFHFQSKLLRVLETWTITRIGSSKPIPVNVRLIAATNRNLAEMVEEGVFRQDLYYRLQVLNLIIPPLRERKEDLLLISKELLSQARFPGEPPKTLSKDATKVLLDYDWPGNVRELRNVINRATLLSKTDVIPQDVLEASIYSSGRKKAASETTDAPSILHISPEERLSKRLQEVDDSNINLLKEALDIAGGNEKKAAEMLEISRNTFYRMLEKYHIEL